MTTGTLGPYEAPVRWLESELWLKDKRGRRRPFVLNRPQRLYLKAKARAIAAGRPPHFLVLKSRRTGITTLEQALSYELTSRHRHRNAITLAHDLESTKKIFEISRFFHRNLGGPTDTQGTAREFRFAGGDSLFWVGTAGSKSFGRGQTLQRIHWSEVAYTPGDLEEVENLFVGLTEACSHGEIVLETTANGASGLFYRLWQQAKQGEGSFTPIFIPWWWDTDAAVPLPKETAAEVVASYTDEEVSLVKDQGLSAEQIAWRRAKRETLRGRWPQEYPANDTEAFLRSGVCFFNVDRLEELAKTRREPTDIRLGGRLHVWEYPREGASYLIGIDSSEGIPGRDPSAACVLDFETGRQVARLWGYFRPPELGRLVVKLAVKYNWAFLVPEINNHGHSTLNTIMVQEGYPSNAVYHRVQFDMGTAKPVKTAGWTTNAKTRPQLLDALCQSLDEGAIEVNDREFLVECRTFNLQKSGKYEADEGEHDDLVIAWGLAAFARLTQMPYLHCRADDDPVALIGESMAAE